MKLETLLNNTSGMGYEEITEYVASLPYKTLDILLNQLGFRHLKPKKDAVYEEKCSEMYYIITFQAKDLWNRYGVREPAKLEVATWKSIKTDK
jgi:hypothetical protein